MINCHRNPTNSNGNIHFRLREERRQPQWYRRFKHPHKPSRRQPRDCEQRRQRRNGRKIQLHVPAVRIGTVAAGGAVRGAAEEHNGAPVWRGDAGRRDNGYQQRRVGVRRLYKWVAAAGATRHVDIQWRRNGHISWYLFWELAHIHFAWEPPFRVYWR